MRRRTGGPYSHVLTQLSPHIYVMYNSEKGLILGGGGQEDCPHCNGTGKRSRQHSIQIPVEAMADFVEMWMKNPNWKPYHRRYLIDVVGMSKEKVDKEMAKLEEEE